MGRFLVNVKVFPGLHLHNQVLRRRGSYCAIFDLRNPTQNTRGLNRVKVPNTYFVTEFNDSQFQRNFHSSSWHLSPGNEEEHSDWNRRNLWAHIGSGLVVLGLGGLVVWKLINAPENQLLAAQISEESVSASKRVIPGLPTYNLSDVAKHYDAESKVWMTLHRGVYDVTAFVAKHPGGDRILMAGGGSLEPFWELYPTHQRPDVFNLLEKFRIGNLAAEDEVKLDSSDTDHFKNEPKRHPALIPRSQKPFNGETPPVLLTQKFYTPNEVFYIRNHLPVPKVSLDSYELEIDGLGVNSKTLKFSDLQKLPVHSVVATLQCAGNRRSEMSAVKPVAGLSWTGGAIGTTEWSGVRLKDVLKEAGFKAEDYKNPHLLHIQFEGMDCDQSGESYGSSIPFSYLLDENFQPLLAFEMNHRPLPLDHGWPVRLILPGIVAARSVKWLSRIVISEEESPSTWQQRDYKVFSPSVTMETVDFRSAPAIQDTPPTSYICSHATGDTVPRKRTALSGYAFSGGGRRIVRVEISLDEGKTWRVGKIENEAEANSSKNYAWTLWSADIDFSQCKGKVQVWVKAVDSGYNQQTENVSSIYNYRGLLSNSFHKIQLLVK